MDFSAEIYVALDENLLFYMGVYALQTKTGPVSQYAFSGECWGVQFPTVISSHRTGNHSVCDPSVDMNKDLTVLLSLSGIGVNVLYHTCEYPAKCPAHAREVLPRC